MLTGPWTASSQRQRRHHLRFVSVICSGDRPPSPGEKEGKGGGREEEGGGGGGRRYYGGRAREGKRGIVEDRGASAEEKREGSWAWGGGRVERWLARQESDSPLIGSIGHCQRRIFSCSLTGRAVRMIAHLSAQKTNKNKPLLI